MAKGGRQTLHRRVGNYGLCEQRRKCGTGACQPSAMINVRLK
jgi:hypothetical protein